MSKLVVYAVIIAFAFSLLIEAASAQGTGAESAACWHDAVHWCKHDLAGGPFTVAGCLSAHKAKLSASCRKVLSAHGL